MDADCESVWLGIDVFTPRKTNMSPEDGWLEDVFPIEIYPLLGDMFLFSGVYCFSFAGYFVGCRSSALSLAINTSSWYLASQYIYVIYIHIFMYVHIRILMSHSENHMFQPTP